MARAQSLTNERQPLYERDFYLWVEEQVRLLRQGSFERLDVANLVEEIADLGSGAKKAVKSNLVVVLLHLLKYQFQPKRRSRSWLDSILEHRQRLRDDLAASPSLRRHLEAVFSDAYADARARATTQTGLSERAFPHTSPYTVDEPSTPISCPSDRCRVGWERPRACDCTGPRRVTQAATTPIRP
jgi:Domain of unknown function DUF29